MLLDIERNADEELINLVAIFETISAWAQRPYKFPKAILRIFVSVWYSDPL